MTEETKWYDRNAIQVCQDYENLDVDAFNAWLLPILPSQSEKILDVGAGSGRDAAWFCKKGFEVTAVEPSSGMHREALKYHGQEDIEWMADSLPELTTLSDRTVSYGLILLSAMWMHIPPEHRQNSLNTLRRLLTPSGHLAISLRIGTTPGEKRIIYDVSVEELVELCKNCGLSVRSLGGKEDELGRPEIKWINVAIRKSGLD